MRTMYRITAGQPFMGKIGPVPFIDGRTETDHEGVVAYCRRHGYTVEAIEQEDDGSGQGDEEVPARPVKSASKEAWKAYAIGQGMSEEDADAATRDALVERYAPKDGGDA
ncbi:hypothetical protein [Nocardiopsis synnemataformans]|uniref:hypothetical protein n=1 Tax=Nocardiopsis synnemataformans TaxID=61305 RepID=UPI003EBEF84D